MKILSHYKLNYKTNQSAFNNQKFLKLYIIGFLFQLVYIQLTNKP